jgi:PAS domain S-box-containing protein
MLPPGRLLFTVVLLLTGVATALVALFAPRHREIPGAAPFALLSGSLAYWSLVYAVAIQIRDPFWRIVVLQIQWLSHPVGPLFILLFALAYTGNDDFLTRRTVAVLAAIPALVVLGAWTNPWHGLLWREQTVVIVNGMAVLIPEYGPLFWLNIVYGYGIEMVGVALLLVLVYRSEYLYADQSALLLIGILTPFLANVGEVFFLGGQASIDLTPVVFSVSAMAFGYALFREQLFDLIPATRKLGRDAAIGQLDTGVVIVDTDRRIVYCNDAAGAVLGCEPAAALGRPVDSLVEDAAIDFDAEDALAEFEREDSIYEFRTSAVTDRHGRRIGHTLVVHDITARKQRELELASQRDQLVTLNELNAVIRGVNQALVSARSREEVERAVCKRIADGGLYRTVCVADVSTWTGDADRWTVAGENPDPTPPALDGGLEQGGEAEPAGPVTLRTGADDDGIWTVVPLVHGRTVYGALGLYSERETVGEREREILGELGETIGHAINAVETEQLLSAETVVELELAVRSEADPLVAATDGGRVELEGILPAREEGPVAYLRLHEGDATAIRDALAAASSGPVRLVSEADGGSGGLLEWQVAGDAPLGALADHAANVHHADADGSRASYEVKIASAPAARGLVEHLQREFDGVRVLSKRERTGPVEATEALPEDPPGDLTERQREVLEAAYRAGYFNWPRDSNAEEVAETLGITSATLHSHLRKAEATLFKDIFDPEDDDRPQ